MIDIILSQKIFILRSKNIIKSNKKTTLKDKLSNKLETNNFVYFVDKKILSKNLFITDEEKNEYFQKNQQ